MTKKKKIPSIQSRITTVIVVTFYPVYKNDKLGFLLNSTMLCFWWKSYKMCPSSFASCWSLNSWCNTGHDVQSQIRQQEKVFYLLLLRRLPRAYRPLFLSLTRSLPLTHSLWSNCAQFTAVISPMSRVSLEPPCQKKIFYSNYYFISRFIFEVFFFNIRWS